MSYQAPPNGSRTFLIVWVTQSISVFGSALTFVSITIWLTQTLYPLPEQKPQLAAALSATALAFAVPVVFGAPIAATIISLPALARQGAIPGAVSTLLTRLKDGAVLVVFCVGQLFNPYLLRVEDKVMLDEIAARTEAELA
jgi:hypothetical protein